MLLGSGEILDASDVQAGVLPIVVQDPADLLLVHAELVAAGEPQQQGNGFPGRQRRPIEDGKLGHGLHGIASNLPLGHQLAHGGGFLIHPRQHILVWGQPRLLADDQFPRGADLKPLHHPVQGGQEEGVGLHGVAQAYPLWEVLPQGGHPLGQGRQVKDVQRRGFSMEHLVQLQVGHGVVLLSSRAFRSTFPFLLRGKVSQGRSTEGTM